MRKADVYYKGELAGKLMQLSDGSYQFQYIDSWVNDTNKPSISLTLSKTNQVFQSKLFFPFFYNMLPEGINKDMICQSVRIDEEDYFGLLIATASYDTIGAVTVSKI
jgi:HipA-like protein